MFHIMKKEAEGDSWPRLMEDKTLEKTNVTIDWDKYVDSDEETEGLIPAQWAPAVVWTLQT